MATNLAIDDRLIEEARRIGKHKTKKACGSRGAGRIHSAAPAVAGARKCFHHIDYDPDYDYKVQRRQP